ncbi:uncharacterized protein A1O9_01258 [Exophiala aquamarina CBS 119918]|uniref:Protein NO VEIN C-terminal domain-containing protein n=1 Tax=Exophiala aquamarina CBS 119918 TaxID=1182545 RepID=A0A072PTX5_9EURO|nr:uncharacterized protein A1O9_01258 [Exophiala aquamarina CBS 119918]KEF63281.1 hypothetical protein A1O9_01258 [Exophiala aquamarina CBS 119918]
MLARRQARELVKGIAEEHGHVGEDVLHQINDPAVRDTISKALSTKDGIIGSAVITLAKDIYTSNSRFVFEMLQNADDNQFTKTADTPFISFHVHPGHIVVECNEDGFQPEHLRAICNVNQSTKKGTQGYIGEKGIGFKSVFAVAWKVLIQSGHYSFYFQHRKGDSGMGMISPIWQEPEEELPSALTRITLFLHNSSDPSFEETQRQISSQFHELQNAFLLFLQNIRKIDITFYDNYGDVATKTMHSVKWQENHRAELKETMMQNGETEECSQYYHVTKHIATGLAKNENREYSDQEEARQADSTSQLILAFPLTHESTPLIEAQSVFAFLPLRQVGFSFLIQGDFVTEISRQDVVNCPRNQGLLDGIANAFIEAVLQLCEHHTLRNQWMRYLPSPESIHFAPFWKALVDKIKNLLEFTPILRPRSEGTLKTIKSLSRLSFEAMDREGNPLFDDIEPPGYLSCDYLFDDLEILKSYGLEYLHMGKVLDRVDKDLNSRASRLKSTDDQDWHSRTAKLLAMPFVMNWTVTTQERVRRLPLLPLQSGVWVSANNGPAYYAATEGVDIPKDLALSLIDPVAARNEDRKALFDHLGVVEAPTSLVRDMIHQKYREVANVNVVNLRTSRSHLEYLYLTQRQLDAVLPIFYRIHVFTQDGRSVFPFETDTYASDNKPYGARELLKREEQGLNGGDGAPGLTVPFLHQDYFENVPEAPVGHPLSWRTFLNRYVFIRLSPRLIRNAGQDNASLSDITCYIQRHRPEIFMAVLHHYSQAEVKKIAEKNTTANELRKMEVLCRGDRMIALSETYLPTPTLECLQARFMADGEFFPFLKLLFPPKDDASSDPWEFLHSSFGVRRHDDLDFYLEIHHSILRENQSVVSSGSLARVFNLYQRIHSKLIESDNRSTEQGMVRELFETRCGVLLLPSEAPGPIWIRPSQCVWDGPKNLLSKYSIKALCETFLAASEEASVLLQSFFRVTLGIPDCTWKHLVEEIKHLKAISCTDFDRMSNLYVLLEGSLSSSGRSDIEALKEAFEETPMIYVNTNGRHCWLKVSECLWASATSIRDRTALNDHYEGLEAFFVTLLGVPELSLDMVLDDLVEKGALRKPQQEIKDTMWVLNSFLSSQTPTSSPDRILRSRVFPVKDPNGQVTLHTAETEFGIIDRQRLGELFAKAWLLDFTLEEVRLLRPFLRWTGLESRFLSCQVKEISQHTGGDPTLIGNRDRDISRKSVGLYRIATHFNSPRVSEADFSLYSVLRRARVYETDGISSLLTLSQCGRNLPIEINRSELHIREYDGELEVYVPRDMTKQEFCYQSKFPRRLLECMMTTPDTQICEKIELEAVLAVTKILNAKPASVNLILEEAGIMDVTIPETIGDLGGNVQGGDEPSNRSVAIEEEGREEVEVTMEDPAGLDTSSTLDHHINTPTTPQSERRILTPRSITRPLIAHGRSWSRPSLYDQTTPSTGEIDSQTSNAAPAVPNLSHLTPSLEVDDMDVSENSQYVALLDKMINRARRMTIPSQGSLNMTELLRALPVTDISTANLSSDGYPFRSATRRERDKKIGAAGELFVFELLSHLDPQLPAFSRESWQSTIREYVRVHPQYDQLPDWSGRETADIIYYDSYSVLTELLVNAGYLDPDRWQGRCPKYYIEVKSTTQHCDTPFYMSKAQYKLMREQQTLEGSPNSIYVVFRVYDLAKDEPGLQVYMDPEAMRRSGGLVFRPETWSVVPGKCTIEN